MWMQEKVVETKESIQELINNPQIKKLDELLCVDYGNYWIS